MAGIKTYLVGLFFAVRTLCRYLNRYRATIDAGINASTLPTETKAKIFAFLDDAQLLCAAFEALAGY